VRGQIWPDVLVIVGAVVLGVLVALSAAYGTIEGTARLLKTMPYVLYAEVLVEHNSLSPVHVVKLYYDGAVFLSALEDTNLLMDVLKDLNVEVNAD